MVVYTVSNDGSKEVWKIKINEGNDKDILKDIKVLDNDNKEDKTYIDTIKMEQEIFGEESKRTQIFTVKNEDNNKIKTIEWGNKNPGAKKFKVKFNINGEDKMIDGLNEIITNKMQGGLINNETNIESVLSDDMIESPKNSSQQSQINSGNIEINEPNQTAGTLQEIFNNQVSKIDENLPQNKKAQRIIEMRRDSINEE